MDYNGLLEDIQRKTKSTIRKRQCDIGLAIDQYMKMHKPRKVTGANVADVFMEILPKALAENCRVESIKSGVMKVIVPSGAFMFQFKTMQSEVLKEIKKQCPSAGIKYIKFTTK